MTKNSAAVALGTLGGSSRSAAKSLASRRNGSLGGRPRKDAPPRSGSAATIRVTIRLTAAEHTRWLERAGDKPLGVWIRERCNRSAPTRPTKEP